MRQDFSKIEDVESFLVPEGTYRCRVGEVLTGNSRDGSERWRFRLEAAEGERFGKTLAWDSITWSDRGMYRVKAVLEAFGFDVSGTLDVDADELKGRLVQVDLRHEQWEDPVTGKRTERMTVPYLGYESAPQEGQESSGWSGDTGGTASAIAECAGEGDDSDGGIPF
ncbi:MAG: hypothetical protein ACI841_000598 [Planctomycetota bacterium]|jgi:hypothetical protein